MYLLLAIILLIVIALIALRLPSVKNKIAQEGLGLVNQEFGTQISADHVEINWKNNLILNQVVAKDDHDYPFIKINRVEGDINILELVKYLYSQDWSFKNLKFKKLILDDPILDIHTYKGEDKDNLSQFIAKFENDKPPDSDPFIFQSDIDFNNGLVKVTNYNVSQQASFIADSLNFKIANFKTKGSIITANLEQMNAALNWNDKKLHLDNFQTNLYYSPTETRLDSMDLKAPGTDLNTDIHLRYQSTDDFKNFANLVNLDIDLRNNSFLNGNFLDFITGNWDNNSTYNVHFLGTGTLNDLLLTQMSFNSDDVKVNAKQMKLNQITNKEDFSLDLQDFHAIASEQSLKSILPSDIASKLNQTIKPFGTLDYQGNLYLNSDLVRGNGQLLSALGQLNFKADLRNYSSKKPEYQGTINAKNVTLYPILNNNSVRQLTGNFDFHGEGFDPKTAKIILDGKLDHVAFEKYTFQNIDLDVNYHQQIIEGKINSQDTQAVLDAEGIVNFSHPQMQATVKGDVKKLNLGVFEPKQGQTIVQGLFDIDAKGSDMSDLVGKMQFKNLIYNSPEKVMAFEEVDINTYFEAENRILKIDAPNNIHGVLKGRFNIDDIPIMFQNGISKMVVGLKPKKQLRHKYLYLDLDIQDNVVDLFFPKLNLESGSNIIGTYDSETNDLILNLSAPKLTYDKLMADSVSVNINTDNPSQQFLIQVNSLYFDNYTLRKINSSGYLKDDTLMVENTFNINDPSNQLVNLNLFQTENNDELIVGVNQSKFEVNDVQWLINPESDLSTNLITYNKKDKTVYLNRFSLVSNIAEISAKGYYRSKEDFEFSANADNVLLEDIIPKNSLGEFKLKGLINGKVDVSQHGHQLKPLANVNVENLEFNTYKLGHLTGELTLDENQASDYNVKLDLIKNDHQYFDLSGVIKNQTNNPASFDANANFDEFEMDILNELLSGVFQNIRGTCSGDVKINGPFKNPAYNGYLVTQDMGLTIEYLQTDYLFKNGSEIMLNGDFAQGSMLFDNISFQDTKEHTEGNLFGSIQNKEFKTWFLDLNFESANNDGLLILNTDIDNNDLFYGKVYADGTFNLYGSTDKNIYVYSDATILPESKFTLNNATTYTIDDNSIIRFKPVADSNTSTAAPNQVENQSGLALNFLLNIDDGAEITILLDEITNSTIQVRGKAENFTFNMSENGEMTMNGDYLVSDGYYNFKIGPLNKKFKIEDNSLINFTGNPYNARLVINAYNEVVVSNIGDYLNIQTSPTTDVDLGVQLSGTLNDMNIDFSVTAPKAGSEIQSVLQSKFYNNPDEERLQFLSLLSSKRFNTEQSALISSATLASNGYDFFLNQLLNIFNSINPDLQIGATYIPQDLSTNSPSMLQATVNLRLNSRWRITTTQGFPINTSSATNNAIWTREVEVEYDVSQKNDQSFIVEAFTRPTSFGVENFASNSSTYHTYGAGVILRWEFDKFSEFINKYKKHPEKKEEEPPINPNDSAAIINKEIDDLMKSEGIIN